MSVMKALREFAISAVRLSHHFQLIFRKPRRVLILDPFLTNSLSHNLNFDLGFGEAFKRRGWTVRVLANRYADSMVISEGETYRFFSSEAYTGFTPYFDSFWWRNANFYADLRSLRFARFDIDNICLLHTITVFELFGLAQWYEELPGNGRPRLIIYIQLGAEVGLTGAEEVSIAKTTYKAAAHKLAKFPSVVICTSSEALLKLFDQEDVCTELVPMPIFWPPTQHARVDNGRVVFGYFGGARSVKGFHLIFDAVSAVLDTVTNADFVINCPYNPDFREDLTKLSRIGDRVRVRVVPASRSLQPI